MKRSPNTNIQSLKSGNRDIIFREKYLSISSSQVPIAHKKIHFDFIETIFSDKVKLNNKMDNFDVIFIRGMKTK